jgi:putative toxin-antitoxin system antitoxin component (TIGR02293 family)
MEVKVLSSIREYQPGPHIPQSIWMSLGLPSRGTTLHDLVREGLPFEYLGRIASLLQVPPGVISKAICIAPSTLARRAKAGRFNTLESDRLIAMVAVFEDALCLFENDVAAATEWMTSPIRGLGSKRPIDMLGARVETKAVVDLIGQLERGVFA